MSPTALSPPDRPKFLKILAQLDAPEHGVLLATALAAQRFLLARGLRFRDVLPGMLDAVDSDPAGNPHESWRRTINQCLARADRLTEWEVGFLQDLREFEQLSPKQSRRLQIIARRAGVQ